MNFLKKSLRFSKRGFTRINLGIILFFSSIVLFFSLFSYNSQDPSFLNMDSGVLKVDNLLWKFGSNIAAISFYLFGVSAYLLLGFIIYLTSFLLLNLSLKKEWDRLFSAFLSIFVVSALFNVFRIGEFNGGLLGKGINSVLKSIFDPTISTLFLLTLTWICLCLLTRLSIVWLVHYSFKFFAFVLNKEKFLSPAYKILKKVYNVISVPFIWVYNFSKKLFSGSDVKESGKNIYEFEDGEFIDSDIKDSRGDAFWKEYLQEEEPEPLASEEQDILEEENIVLTKKEEEKKYSLPDLEIFTEDEDILDDPKRQEELNALARVLEEKLERFGVYGEVVSIKAGPVITLFEYKPQIDSKISKIIALEDDLALALQAMSIRIIAPIPGKSVVGFEISNKYRKNVFLSSVIKSEEFENFKGELPLILGKDIIGREEIVDLVRMPHLLIAGSTGSGKSISLNTMLVSLLCKLTPDELKLILIDPKRLEFSSYADIAHLIFPIVTDPKRAAPILKWVVKEMEERYEKISKYGVRNIQEYKKVMKKKSIEDEMPYIVIIIDELSDLMMTSGKAIEDLIARIAQMARAAGIHMIIATQRPSVDVITGLIKVNFPSRISFRVTSKIDSRTILDAIGADKLLGRGDMLFLDSSSSLLRRIHGAYVSDREIENLVEFIRAEREVEYLDLSEELTRENDILLEEDEELYRDVLTLLDTIDEVSISMLQRKFRIGYNRSARIIDVLESQGLIMPAEGSKPRKVIRQ